MRIVNILGRALLYCWLFIAGIMVVCGVEVNYNKERAKKSGLIQKVSLTAKEFYNLVK